MRERKKREGEEPDQKTRGCLDWNIDAEQTDLKTKYIYIYIYRPYGDR